MVRRTVWSVTKAAVGFIETKGRVRNVMAWVSPLDEQGPVCEDMMVRVGNRENAVERRWRYKAKILLKSVL